MAYKKPEIVAKSEAKKTFVAACPHDKGYGAECRSANVACVRGPIK